MIRKILIVDDDPDILKILIPKLRNQGYEVISTGSGNEAIKLAFQFKPDIILLDTMIPGLKGFEVKAALNENRLTASIPVVFLSYDFMNESKLWGFNSGVTDFISKPLDIEELVTRVNEIINKQNSSNMLTIIDSLTGLYNDEFFKKQLSYFFDLAKRYSKTFSLIVIEISDLNMIADMYKHAVRDCILEEFSSIAARCIRSSDILARCENNDFAILLPEADIKMALSVIDKLKKSISNNYLSIPGLDEKIYFSISAGAAEYDSSYERGIDVFNSASNKMNEDKASARLI